MIWCYSFCSILMFYFFLIGLFLVFLGINFVLSDIVYFIEYEFFMFNGVQLIMTLLFDWMSLIFMGFVLIISSQVIYYSSEYMINDKFLVRFIIMVLLFVFSMIFMIISPNLISILLGWDGLGLISYCLVIYYQNISSFNSGMVTALFNRVGDSMLLMSIAWMINYGSWNYFIYLDFFEINFVCSLIGLLIVIAAMTSSAQIPFSPWLPLAMAAPTPVSSLVHSSTLVTAGVYLLIRFNPLYVNTYLSYFLFFISLTTMFMSGICANFEYDLSKIIALSTLSQLGLMMCILSLGYIYLAYFHMLTHALFKASLFMCSGGVIHLFSDCQDIRYLGNLLNPMPLISVCIIISSLCLCGMPFLSGFYSKDLILDIFSMGWYSGFSYIIFYFSIGLTVMYSFRLIYYLMISDFCFYSFHSCYDVSFVMVNSISLMIILSVFGGSFLMWILFPTPYLILLPLYLSVMVLITCLMGGIFGYYLISFDLYDFFFNYYFVSIFTFFGSMWFFPYLSTKFSYPMFTSGYLIFNVIDQGWLEYFGGSGFFYFMSQLSKYNQYIHNMTFNLFFLIICFWFIILFLF